MELIFEISNKLGMNPFSRLWITIEYGLFSEMDTNTPWYMMDLRVSNCSSTNENTGEGERANQNTEVHGVGTGVSSSVMTTVACCVDYLMKEDDELDFNNR